jgi:cytochrome c oxidase subunit 3
MEVRSVVDVGDWSRFATKHHHPLWWGVLGLVVIEVTVVAGFLVSYFYLGVAQGARPELQSLAAQWPPHGVRPLPLLYPSINVGLLLLCAASMFYAGLAMRKEQRGRLVASFVFCTVAGLAVLYLRWLQLQEFGFRWSEHAYGSMVWLLTGFHFAHVTSAVLGTAAIGVLCAVGYFGERRQLAVDVDTMYWYFVSFAFIPIYLVLYWVPRFL